MGREKGIVKWFSTDKGYGFIRREHGEEIFVHHTDIDVDGYAALKNGETVEFEVFESDRGPKARNLVPLNPDGSPRPAGRPKSEGRAGKPEGRSGKQRNRSRSRSDTASGDSPVPDGAKKSLAEQLRERLARRFPGLGD